MTTLLATGEAGCVFSSTSITLSGVPAPMCGTFAESGASAGAVVDIVVVASETRLAIYSGAIYNAGVLALPSPLKTIGALVPDDVVKVYATYIPQATPVVSEPGSSMFLLMGA